MARWFCARPLQVTISSHNISVEVIAIYKYTDERPCKDGPLSLIRPNHDVLGILLDALRFTDSIKGMLIFIVLLDNCFSILLHIC